MMEILDADNSGGIDWEELSSRALWALNQFEEERDHWTLDDLLSAVFEKHLLPEAFKRVQELIRQRKAGAMGEKKSMAVKAIDKLKMRVAQHKGLGAIQEADDEETVEDLKVSDITISTSTNDHTKTAGDSAGVAEIASEVLKQHKQRKAAIAEQRFRRIASAFDIDPDSDEFKQPTTQEELYEAEVKAAKAKAAREQQQAEGSRKAAYFRKLASTFDIEMEEQSRSAKAMAAKEQSAAVAAFSSPEALPSLVGSDSFLGSGRWSVTTAAGVARNTHARGAVLTGEDLPECVTDSQNFYHRVAQHQRELEEQKQLEVKRQAQLANDRASQHAERVAGFARQHTIQNSPKGNHAAGSFFRKMDTALDNFSFERSADSDDDDDDVAGGRFVISGTLTDGDFVADYHFNSSKKKPQSKKGATAAETTHSGSNS